MRIQEIGFRLRQARAERGVSQSALAKSASVSRTLLNQFESGLLPDITISKLQALLEKVELALAAEPRPPGRPDFVAMACTTASVSYRHPLTESELIRALLTGKPSPGKRANFRTLFDEAPQSLLDGVVDEVGQWTKPGRVRKNVASIAQEIGSVRNVAHD